MVMASMNLEHVNELLQIPEARREAVIRETVESPDSFFE
jgi:hypothetical protein